jgi:hypothetical protein
MKTRVREFVVIAVKTAVSALVAWLAVREIEIPDEVRTSVEALLTGLGVGVVNWVLNVAVGWARKIPGAASVLDIIWPTPVYNPEPNAVVITASQPDPSA